MRPSFNRMFQTGYNRLIRPFTPSRISVYNGVGVRASKYFDFTDVVPDYESPLIDAIREYVEPGDRVGIVGGGLGVSAVWAARSGGQVVVYEAASERVGLVKETAEINKEAESITVEHAIVGDVVEAWGDSTAAPQIQSEDFSLL